MFSEMPKCRTDWDKEKKQARTKQVYLGKLDPETGAFVPSKRFGEDRVAAMDSAVTVKTHVSGPAMLSADRPCS